MYNLMMVSRENFWDEQTTTVWELERFLAHTDPAIKVELGKLDLNARGKLLSFPCLFMYEFSFSFRDGIGAPHSPARVGVIRKITNIPKGVIVDFTVADDLASIDSQKLSECWEALEIDVRKNENCRTHWAVKDVDLMALLFGRNLLPSHTSRPGKDTGGAPPETVPKAPPPLDVLKGWSFASSKPADAPEVVQALREIADTAPRPTGAKPRVFVVHGRDDGRKNEVARWLAKVGMEETILHEHPNLGRSILTKFRDLAKDTSFAVVIATPDDVGGLAKGSQSARARQNVILELGFFIGVLGPERVALLRCDPELEIPSDYSGILMVDYDARGAWKVDLAKEFKALGIPFDASALV